jgi:hypothetical protein
LEQSAPAESEPRANNNSAAEAREVALQNSRRAEPQQRESSRPARDANGKSAAELNRNPKGLETPTPSDVKPPAKGASGLLKNDRSKERKEKR